MNIPADKIESMVLEGVPSYEIAEILGVTINIVEAIADKVHQDYYYDDSMDGDAQSALASIGWGTDEDYGYDGSEDQLWD